ncbi:S8/S53 family peptidase (plasmid) [Rhizobium sp. CB3171]|uniref:S8/S53 family peptidase n=1 Tax=Rhizobium sp. CB3171 TaxID=3039157 RepID=UPI0024B18D75|nr:S8/S53 family peptidase [Rhizobium sp. CB3171]WFU06781.1 S8/S53 family peptidase [Rhizobium sp. CB3171]
MQKTQLFPIAILSGLVMCLLAATGFAGEHGAHVKGSADAPTMESSASRCAQNADDTFCWMGPDIGQAWASGYTGSGVSITIVDDFRSSEVIDGDLGLGPQRQRHGEWVFDAAGMVAPGANMFRNEYAQPTSIALQDGLNVFNLSYAHLEPVARSSLQQSIVDAALAGDAVFTKAAGNDAAPVGTVNSAGDFDYLAASLMGAPSTIFVGALEHNGTPENKASLASYSNYPGSNREVQNQFLTVGVEGDKTGLFGTSLGAPVISGYSAILGSKFPSATPTQIANQLLDTARTDTLVNYNSRTYGRGEASLSRALAPDWIR